MPVEIRELVIRAVTTMDREDSEDANEESPRLLSQGATDGTEAIVQECVRQVLRILRKEKER
jgi:hypothetical protein